MSENRAGVPSRIPDLDADAISSHDRREQLARARRLSAKEMRDLFADFPAIKVNQNTSELRVRCPWDREISAALGAVPGARFNARTKVWHFRLHAWQTLLELAPRIQKLVEDAWDDGFVEGAHRDGDDLRIVIPEARRSNYPVNSVTRFKGEPFIISHIGRPYLLGARAVCNVYLVLALAEEPLATAGRAGARPEDAEIIDHTPGPRGADRGAGPAIDISSDDPLF